MKKRKYVHYTAAKYWHFNNIYISSCFHSNIYHKVKLFGACVMNIQCKQHIITYTVRLGSYSGRYSFSTAGSVLVKWLPCLVVILSFLSHHLVITFRAPCQFLTLWIFCLSCDLQSEAIDAMVTYNHVVSILNTLIRSIKKAGNIKKKAVRRCFQSWVPGPCFTIISVTWKIKFSKIL